MPPKTQLPDTYSDTPSHLQSTASILCSEYFPPAVATLVAVRNRGAYQRLEAWRAPPGWNDSPSILDFPVYPAARPGLLVRRLGESLAVHDGMTLDTHSLNEGASCLFRLCDGTRSVQAIGAAYRQGYRLDPTVAAKDVRRILGELFEKKVLVPRRSRAYADPRGPEADPTPSPDY